MALQAPPPLDVVDIQFKVNTKLNLIKQEVSENKGNLLAAASTYGLVIIGSSEPNLRVLQLSRIIDDKEKDVIPSRSIPLPAPAHAIALSCDHSMLAVNFKQNELSFVTVFSVPSFLSTNVKILQQTIRLGTDDGVAASEMLWNPVLSSTLAICLSNKSLLVFAFKEQGYDLYSINKSEQVGCASWSPKGKQIVAGFPNGTFAQYKPDLKLARTIPCTLSLYNTAWEVIAVQWLSTYQFAAIMYAKEENACPALYIVYAPKNGNPTYTNYKDVCYSQTVPRSVQVTLTHILQWNLLLIISATSAEVGVLGTTETGDNPLWKQYTMLDEARAELPLTAKQDDMYPIGVAVDTGTTHRIVVNEKQLNAMPMLHMLSTHGLFISFNILDTTGNLPSICSPPQLTSDMSGISSFILTPHSIHTAVPSDLSFSFPAAATSTPRITQKSTSLPQVNEPPKASALFKSSAPVVEPAKGFVNIFRGQTTIQPISSAQSAFSFVQKSSEPTTITAFGAKSSPQAGIFEVTPATTSSMTTVATVTSNLTVTKSTTTGQTSKSERTKPFVTVPVTFSETTQAKIIERATRLKQSEEQIISDDDIIKKMILEEVHSYEVSAKAFLSRCKCVDISIGTKEELAGILKQLNELQDISNEATESIETLAFEIQSLKISLNETYLMIAELKSKHSLLTDVSYSQLRDVNSMSHTSRRQLEKLQKLLAVNENQYGIVMKQINANWSLHEENKKQNVRKKMHVPTLEHIYQTLAKQRDIINRQNIKINYIKSRLGYKEILNSSKKSHQLNVTSLTDSMVSVSLRDQVKFDTERLSAEKLHSLRDFLRNRKIVQITPNRPERIGLNSEIVVEKRKEQEKKKALNKNAAVPKQISSKLATQSAPNEVINVTGPETNLLLSKPTSKSELHSILKSNKTTPKAPSSNESSEIGKYTVTFNFDAAKQVDKFKVESSTFGKGFTPADTVTSPFSSKPSITFGNASGDEKSSIAIASGLFNNLSNTNLSSNFQPSALFGSATPTSALFGSQSSNAIISSSKADAAKAEKSSVVSDTILQKAAFKTSDKENINKIEVPKLLHGGIAQEKTDEARKPVTQSFATNFGIASTAPAAVSVMPPSQSLNTKAAQSPTICSLLTSSQSNDTPSSAFPIPMTTTSSKPAVSVNAASANAPAANNVQSVESDFTFSLDKLGLASKNAAPDVPQDLFFNIDQNVGAAVTSNVTTSDGANKMIQNPTVFQQSTTDKNATTPSGNIFSIASFAVHTKPENTTSIFGGNAAAKTPFSSLSTLTVTPTSKPSVFASPFSSPNVTVSTSSPTSGGIFANADQSLFSQQSASPFGASATSPSANLFGANAFETPTSSTAPFSSTAANTIFGATTTSPFGNAATTNTFGAANTNAFGTTATNFGSSSTSSSNLFGGSASPTSAFGSNSGNTFNSNKSIFGGGSSIDTTFGSSANNGNSLFGASAAASASPFTQTSQSTGSLFGSASFGSGTQTPTASIFGGGSASSSGFAQPSFGSSSFSQHSSPFAPSGAGGFPSSGFGATPTFGGQPTFGAAATFGSPKTGFGTFANVTSSFGQASTQQNSLFETLGSSDAGVSFGNIAQSSNNSAPKPAFGGGSFSTWR